MDEWNQGATGRQTEYARSIRYGRPLFAAMELHDRLSSNLNEMMNRMLLAPSNWEECKSSWISILATRFQMGQTTAAIASDMVAEAYANIVSAADDASRICVMPDPVCARLAMCLMDESWNMGVESLSMSPIYGKPKKWWTSKVREIYSKGLCVPEKGDLGEIMVAMYFLFSADALRCVQDPDYKTFSVSLSDWIRVLVNGENVAQKEDLAAEKSTKGNLSFGAIQVCRNYVRAYDQSWEALGDPSFLAQLYDSGVGFYVFAGCESIDLVFPLKRSHPTREDSYIPMFVSVKSHVYFSSSEAVGESTRMETKANESGIDCALCLLVVFGSRGESNDNELRLTESRECEERLLKGETVSKVLRVPHNDEFGVSKAFLEITAACELPEILASQSFLGAHGASGKNTEEHAKSFAEFSLRACPKRCDDTMLTMATELLKQPKGGNSTNVGSIRRIAKRAHTGSGM